MLMECHQNTIRTFIPNFLPEDGPMWEMRASFIRTLPTKFILKRNPQWDGTGRWDPVS